VNASANEGGTGCASAIGHNRARKKEEAEDAILLTEAVTPRTAPVA
jgi:hypothetical protein